VANICGEWFQITQEFTGLHVHYKIGTAKVAMFTLSQMCPARTFQISDDHGRRFLLGLRRPSTPGTGIKVAIIIFAFASSRASSASRSKLAISKRAAACFEIGRIASAIAR
jgi:hypothetical protein